MKSHNKLAQLTAIFKWFYNTITWFHIGYTMKFYAQINNVSVNPMIDPPPQKWWLDSFDYYFAFPLESGKKYGPLFRIGSKEFSPIIGNANDQYSESQCFYGFTCPKDVEEAREIYDLHKSNPCEFVHKFYLEIPIQCENALLFIGPAKNGNAIQVGINSKVAELIREAIKVGKINTSRLD